MNKFTEIVISGFVIVILLAFLIHEPFLMPMGVQMLLLVAVSILFLALVTFFFKEESRDEREKMHKLAAGRISFVAGTISLLVGMVFGIIHHNIDPFLPITLVVMVVSKVIYRLYSDAHK